VTTRLGVTARAVVLAMLLIGALSIIFWRNSLSPEPDSHASQPQAARVIGGEVSAGGAVVLGRGYSLQHPATGEYRIVFEPSLFPDGCPVLSVTPLSQGNLIAPEIGQTARCSRTFYVHLSSPGTNRRLDRAFQFIAVEAR
jgi:hypothetical protein